MNGLWNKKNKICSNEPGNMTKTIYGLKPFKHKLLKKRKADDLAIWYVASGALTLRCLFKR